jgi:hypothetical protein
MFFTFDIGSMGPADQKPGKISLLSDIGGARLICLPRENTAQTGNEKAYCEPFITRIYPAANTTYKKIDALNNESVRKNTYNSVRIVKSTHEKDGKKRLI